MQHALWTAAFTFLAVTAFAEGPHFEAGTSLVQGEALEFVLRDGTYRNPISRLAWPVPPSLAVTLSVEWPLTSWTSTKVTMEGTLPLTTGTLIDEDWNTGTAASDYSYARSQHTAYMTSRWSISGEQEFTLPNGFQVGAGLLYRWTSWEAWNGSGHYVQNSGSVSDINFSGLVLAYRQQWTIPFVSASWTAKLNGGSLTPSVRFSPFTFCEDIDNHNYAGSASHAYVDSYRGGAYAKAGLELALPDSPAGTWGVRVANEWTWDAIGNTTNTTTYQYSTTYSTTSNTAGAKFQEVTLTIFMRN